jgi:hypothetical protein
VNNIANALTLLLLAVLVPTAVLDIMRNPRALAATSRLGIPEEKVPVLGGVKLLAVLGLLIGTDYARLGQLTGACLVLYFAVAVLTHVRVRDGVRHTAPAFVMLVLGGLFLLASIAK